jgi:hypothetical protein
MFIHDLIKIRYIKEGYLQNYPYHLISDREMFDAFILDTESDTFFQYYYPMPETISLTTPYSELVKSIKHHILSHIADNTYEIPSWVYGYMLGTVIGIRSRKKDIHDLIAPLGVDNIDDDYNAPAMEAVYGESLYYLSRVQLNPTVDIPGGTVQLRPATMFGEPHVIKSIRMRQSEL